MNDFEKMLAQLKACDVKSNAANAALLARGVVLQAMGALYRACGEEYPSEASFLEVMGGRCVRALVRERGLSAAFEFVRVLGSHAMHDKRVTKNAATAALGYATAIVSAMRDKVAPGSAAHLPGTGMSEAETRKEYIDLFLSEAGWELVGHDDTPQPCKAGTEIKVTGMPPSGQDGYCDYVLYGSRSHRCRLQRYCSQTGSFFLLPGSGV